MTIPNLSDRIYNHGAGYRNNNPGNRTGVDNVFGSGVENSSHKWTKYENWKKGYAGNCLLLLKYLDGTQKSKYGLGERNPCMISIIYTWCPPGDGNNDSAGYVSQMCEWCGIAADDKIAITENNLVAMELAKGCKDSGCVQRQACVDGVRMAINHYKKNGGHLDEDGVDLGKVDSELIEKLKNGIPVSAGGNASESVGGAVSSQLGTNGALYTNGNGVFTGTSWGEPIKKGEISAADAFVNVSKSGMPGVILGTHIRQK